MEWAFIYKRGEEIIAEDKEVEQLIKDILTFSRKIYDIRRGQNEGKTNSRKQEYCSRNS